MIKRIKFDDIKKYLIDKEEPYKILEAHSSSSSISVYFNNSQRINVFCKCENMYEYEFQEIVEENVNTIHGCNKADYCVLSFITIFFILYPITFLLTLYTSLSIYSEYTFLISFFISSIITTIFSLINNCRACIIHINRTTNFSSKSNHSAEHMICDFISHKHRLPKNIHEFRRAKRITKFCSTYNLINQDYLSVITNMFFATMVSIAISGFLIYLGLPIILSSIFCNCLFLLLYIICYKKQIRMKRINKLLTKLGNYFLQYVATTTKNVTDESLIMAYIAGSQWFKLTHYEEFDENAYISFLSSLDIVSVHKCEKVNQP